MFKVFHANNPTFGLSIGPQPQWPQDFALVAEVTCENINQAFELTNSIDHAWYENPDVKVIHKARSTSVGDVIKDMTTQRVYLCKPVGWEEIKDAA
jgi:hypothetical protein